MEKFNIYLKKAFIDSFCPDYGFSQVTLALMRYLNINLYDSMHINVCEIKTPRGLLINIGEFYFLVHSNPTRDKKKQCSINITVRTQHSCITYYVQQLSLLDDADASFIKNYFDISFIGDDLPF